MYSKKEVEELTLKYFKGDDLATQVWIKKYCLKDEQGNLLEKSPDDMHRRMAKEFARIEATYPNSLSEEEIYQLFKDFKYVVPGGSQAAGIGNNLTKTSLSNCFVIDSAVDSYGGIFQADQEQVQIMKRRGGVGHDISNIRPSGMLANNSLLLGSAGQTLYMERFSNSTREVAQDNRRGALLLSTHVNHPDCDKFIDMKMQSGKVTGANVSVKISDEFMDCLDHDLRFLQRFPINSIVGDMFPTVPVNTLALSDEYKSYPEVNMARAIKAVNPKSLWDKIIHNAWKSAEPGVLFWDTILRESPAGCYGEGWKEKSTNPSLRGDTLINTERGFLPIKEVAENYPDIKLLTIDQKYVESYVRKTGTKPLYKITLSNNQEVFCTAEHKWPVMSGKNNQSIICNDSLKKKETSSLKVGDRFFFPSMVEAPQPHLNNFSKEDGFALGWIYGDGWETKRDKARVLGFIFGDNDVDNGISEKLLTYTNSNASQDSHLTQGTGKSKRYSTQDKNVINKFDELGWNKDKSLGIPDSVFRSNLNFIKGFVDGMISSDGHVYLSKTKESLNAVVFTSIHKKLVEDLRKLMSLFGISSTIYNYTSHTFGKDHLAYRMHIGGSYIKRFAEIFSLSHKEKQRKLEQAIDNGLPVKHWLTIKAVELTDQVEDVYDATVNDWSHTFFTEVGLTGNCGEIPLCPYDSCRLTALNLYSYVIDPFTPRARFDFPLFRKHVNQAQRIMDDLIDLEVEKIDIILSKIESDPEPEDIKRVELNLWKKIREKAVQGRRTGLGITAEGDMLAALGFQYGTKEATEFAVIVHKELAIESYIASIEMAEERGAFPIWDKDKEMENPFINRVIGEFRPPFLHKYLTFGRRNIANLTIAPVGTGSLMTQTTSGIECLFQPFYKRRTKTDDKSKAVYIDEMDDGWLEYWVMHPKFIEWFRINNDVNGEIVSFEEARDQWLGRMPEDDLQMFFKDSPYYKATANDIDWEESVKMQGAVQKWIDHSISKTVNLPADATIETVDKVYRAAYHSGCKGVTIYRDGCRQGVLLTGKEEKKEEFEYKSSFKRPQKLECDIYHKVALKQDYMIIVGKVNGNPYEIFALRDVENCIFPTKIEKGYLTKVKSRTYELTSEIQGKTFKIANIVTLMTADQSTDTRKYSSMLRHGMHPQHIVDQIDEYASIVSFDKVIQRVLKNYIKEEQKKEKCPECGSENYHIEEGCAKCVDCGHSRCG